MDASYVSVEVLVLQIPTIVHTFYVCSGDPNSGLYICVVKHFTNLVISPVYFLVFDVLTNAIENLHSTLNPFIHSFIYSFKYEQKNEYL